MQGWTDEKELKTMDGKRCKSCGKPIRGAYCCGIGFIYHLACYIRIYGSIFD